MASVLAVPLVVGGWRTALAGLRGLVQMLRRVWQARHPVCAAPLVTTPPRPELSLGMRRFAHMTRCLIASLEHASQRSAGWRDGAPSSFLAKLFPLGRDEEFRPTIGVTGEVWAWLQTAEDVAESDELEADQVAALAAAVRELLFREGPVGPRLAQIVEHLLRADTGFRVSSGGPYRARPTGPSTRPLGDDEEPDDAYDRTIREHAAAIQNVARQYATDDASREDLVQEIKLALWNALDRFRGESSIKTYVLRIAHYRGVSFSRRQRPHAPVEDRVDPTPAPPELIDDARRRHAVAEAIEALPTGQRDAIVLLLEGLSYREIGKRLGISDGTTSARITRARQTLRRRLAEG